MCSGKDVPNSLRSSAGLTFFVTLALYIPLWLRRGLFPASWCTFSSSIQRSGTAEPAGVPWRGINPCLVLHNAVTCLVRIPISLQVNLRHISVVSPCPHHHHVSQQHSSWQNSLCIQKLSPGDHCLAHGSSCTVSHATEAHLSLYQLFLHSRAWNFH